jgi:hypothetical protein
MPAAPVASKHPSRPHRRSQDPAVGVMESDPLVAQRSPDLAKHLSFIHEPRKLPVVNGPRPPDFGVGT